MRLGIVFKLFALTTSLCMLILAVIYMGQTVFFKQYYANRKVNDIQTNIQAFEQDYLKSDGSVATIQKLEQDFYRQNNTWITTLDSTGNLKHANDFYAEVKLDRNTAYKEQSNTTITVPLYNLINIEEVLNATSTNSKFPLASGVRVIVSEVRKDLSLIPYRIQLDKNTLFWVNDALSRKLDELTLKIKYSNSKAEFPAITLNGIITKIELPAENNPSNWIYSNSLFMERIKQFQADLLVSETPINYDSLQIFDYEQNNVKYKLFINPIQDQSGETTYIFSIASLQPVDEAVQMLKDYYWYIIALVMALIVLASLYYSLKIARPLLKINKTTRKIASLDFSERIPIRSKDEIGDLSQNINLLSETLHSYIEQLQQDIEKEKQLERTRKEFISGVSHELKTPLSVMKSCISILKDGVASHKKEHYFDAMDKEVDRMNLLIVDMLELAKFESGTYKMKMDAFYIDKVIEGICDQLSVEMAEKQLNVHTYLTSVEVIANQHRIEQVITNFVTNAIRYTPDQQDIMITTVEEKQFVKICIENKGIHIDVEQLDKLWDRFYRGDAARQRSQGGSGLGLAISKNILELHDVPYGAENTADGVLFYFYLNKST